MIKFATPLCSLAYEYGTDKCPNNKHGFTPIYYKILKNKRSHIRKVLEIGVGYYKDMERQETYLHVPSGIYYHKGASLKMWRDFLPNALIYGADLRPETVFTANRIKTFVCDETKEEDIRNLIIQTGSDIDLFIDDASHAKEDQVYLAKTVIPLLKTDVIYFIEDVSHPSYLITKLNNYNCTIYNGGKHWQDDNLVMVNKQPTTNFKAL